MVQEKGLAVGGVPHIREERPSDEAAISALITAAFAAAPHSSGTEAAIVERLRIAGALAISLVADDEDGLVGHAALSPVTVADAGGWFGLGPVSVDPRRQGQGIGGAMITAAIDRLKAIGARGCVVVGEPDYYGRFGFVPNGAVTYAGVPPPFVQTLELAGPAPTGEVRYHPAFDA